MADDDSEKERKAEHHRQLEAARRYWLEVGQPRWLEESWRRIAAGRKERRTAKTCTLGGTPCSTSKTGRRFIAIRPICDTSSVWADLTR
jgi:hypothetical protein